MIAAKCARCELDESEEGSAELVVASGNPAELLELIEEAFNMVALAVERLLPSVPLLAIGAVGNVGNGTLSPDVRTNTVRIVAFVGNDHGTLLKTGEQRFGAGNVMHLAGRDQEADWATFRVDPRVDLRAEASSTSPHTTISTLFLTPEAC